MLGVIVNTVAVIIGSSIGLLCKKGIPKKFSDAIMTGIALCTLYIGISGALKGENTIVLIFSMVLGAIVGTALDIDGHLNRLGGVLENRFSRSGEKGGIAQAFVTASLLFCVGAMTIVGSLTAGLTGDNEMLFTKSVLDLISSSMLSVSLGIGVLFSAAFVFVMQGALVLLSGLLEPVLTTAAINEIICSGSLLIIGLGLNMLGITKIKVANYLPAFLFAPVVLWLASFIPGI
ncbi:MAG: DUF554 domain-containing protein [Oscillospiraceae bacterium]|nr:DUF554 domain-containing protein [Oscillospiraceae bacterium]